MCRCLPWLLGLLLFWPSPLAAEPLLEEIRDILRMQMPNPPDEDVLQGLNHENLKNELRVLDPYAGYYTREELQEPAAGNTSWAGIGGELFSRQGQMVISPYQEGALVGAGITERVILLAVDGKSVQKMALEEAANMLKGEPGSSVELRLRELSGGHEREITVARERFRPLDVELLQPGDQAVLKLRGFRNRQTRSALKASIDFLGAGEKQVFIDLRESTGGDLFEALDCAALFLPSGKSLGGIWKRGTGEKLMSSPPGEKFSGEVVLLTGPDTASAAEAFAAALAYHGRAVLVGWTTFGKCTTQTRVNLSDGSVLQFTNGLILAPDGGECSSAGLNPDVLVPKERLYDTTFLVNEGLPALAENIESPKPRAKYSLERLAAEGRLTVRAMRAWDKLPTRYVLLVLDLLELDLDLLEADAEQVQRWADMAASSDDPGLASHAAKLKDLARYMDDKRRSFME